EWTVVHGQGVLPVTGPPTRGDLTGRLVAIDVQGPQPGVVEHAVRLLRGGEHALMPLERRLLVRHGPTLASPAPHRGPWQRSVENSCFGEELWTTARAMIRGFSGRGPSDRIVERSNLDRRRPSGGATTFSPACPAPSPPRAPARPRRAGCPSA